MNLGCNTTRLHTIFIYTLLCISMIELVLGLPTTSVLPKLKQNFVRFWYSERSFVVSRELAEIFVGEIPEKVNNQARSTTTSSYRTNNLSSTHNIRDIMFVLHSPLRGFTDLFWKVSTLIYAPKNENTKNSTESIKQTESLLTELNKMICQIPGLGEELIQLLVSMNFTSQNIQILLNSLSDLDKYLGKDIAESQIVEIIADISLKEWEQLDKLMYCKHKINIKLEYSGYQWGLEIEQYKNQQLFYEQLRHFYQLSYTKKLNKAYNNYEAAIKKIETSIRAKRKLIEWIFFYWTNKTQECLKNAKDSRSKQSIQRKALIVVKLAAALSPYQVTTNEITKIEMTLSHFIKDLLILFGFTPIDMFCTTFLSSLRDIVKHGDSFFYYRSTRTPNIWIHIGSNDLLEFTSQRREVLKWLYFAFSRNIFLQQDVGLIITTSSRKEEERFLSGNDKLNCSLKFCPSRFDINQRNESTSLLALYDAVSIPLNEINTLDELFILFDSLFEIIFIGY